MRKYGKVDGNQRETVAALRQIGCSVQSLASVGNGCLDLLVGLHGENYILELKTPGGKLTPLESKWLDEWRGQAAVVFSADEAVRYVLASGK